MDVKQDFTISIQQKIGQGAFGKVYRCLFNNQLCALKIVKFKNDYVCSKEELGRRKKWHWETTKREVTLLKRLNHQNIVKILSCFYHEIKVKISLVLELMDNGSLRDLLEDYKKNKFSKLSERNLLGFTLDFALGLKYLHENDVIHRDLKPENLLFDSNFRLKIADFGISKWTVESQSAKKHSIVGTPLYMAPEVLWKQKYDNSVDVWAFGLIFAEMVLTEYPLTREKKTKILDYSIEYTPLQINMTKQNYSQEAQSIIDASLQRDPLLRWSIADICVLPIFSKISPPKPTALKISTTHNEKENKCKVDKKKRRETTYEQFCERLNEK